MAFHHPSKNQPWGWIIAGVVTFAFMAFAGFSLYQQARDAARKSVCRNNLKQINLALSNYHNTYGTFPPAYVTDNSGTPIHSWRVLLLPFLDQQALYDQYRFDEPWNGPHNSKLIGEVPDCYHCWKDSSDDDDTASYLAVVGPDTAWHDSVPSSQPTAVVECANSGIKWTEPRDVTLADVSLRMRSEHVKDEGGAHMLFPDGRAGFRNSSVIRSDAFRDELIP